MTIDWNMKNCSYVDTNLINTKEFSNYLKSCSKAIIPKKKIISLFFPILFILIIFCIHSVKADSEPSKYVCMETLTGHSDYVTSVTFSPNNQWLASCSDDETIKIWNATNWSNIKTLTEHSDYVNSLSFSPENEWLASCSDDDTIKIWNTSDWSLIKTITEHSDDINSVAFSPNNQWLATCSDDNTIKIWNTTDWSELKTLTNHSDYVNTIAFSENNQWLASGSDDDSIKIWNTSDWSELETFMKHTDWVNSVDFSSDNQWLASGSDDNTIKIWNTTDWSLTKTITDHSDYVNSIAFSSNNEWLASCSDDETVIILKTSDWSEINTLTDHNDYVNSVAFPSDNQRLASGSSDSTIKIWGNRDTKDWIVNETEIHINETIYLDGNLTIENSGNLTFRNVTLIFNCIEDGEFGIFVENGGDFYIFDYDNNPQTTYDRTNITANNTEYEFRFLVEVGAEFEMWNSELSECGYESGNQGEAGLTIKANNSIIDNSNLHNNHRGISLRYSSDNQITNNSVSNNGRGIHLGFSSNNNQITNNSVYYNNNNGIWLDDSSNNQITNNTVSNNDYGIRLFSSCDNNQITNNTVTNNNDGIFARNSNNNQIINNSVSNNTCGIKLYNLINNQIINNSVSNNVYGIHLYNSSNNQIINSTISDSTDYDFYLDINSNITALNTTFDKDNVYFEDENSEIIVKWYLSLKIIDNKTNRIQDAKVRIQDNENGNFDENYITDSEGFVNWINLTEYIESSSVKTYYTLHTISVDKDNFIGSIEIDLDKSKEITITLREIIHWTINGTEVRINETIILNGNLTIQNDGNLTLRNVTLIMNNTWDGEFGIYVENGGKFYILDYDDNPKTTYDRSNITAFNTSHEFKFLIDPGAEFEMRNSELSECGYSFGNYGETGLTIKANNSIIDNSTFFNNYNAINPLKSNNNEIINNSFIFGNYYGIVLSSSDNNIIYNNNVSNNQNGFRLSSADNNQISNNIVSNNGNGIYSSSSDNNIFMDNTIFNCNQAIYLGSCNGNSFINNNMDNSNYGFYLSSSRNNQIINSSITNSSGYDFYYWSNSDFDVINTTFNKNSVNIRDANSDITVKWYLHVKVIDENNIPIQNARINVKNKYGEEIYNNTNGLDGWSRWIVCTEYIQYESGTIVYYTEHTIKAEKDDILINILDVNIDASMTIILQAKPYNIIVDCDEPDKSINPGDHISFKIKIINKGTKSDIISLEIINPSSYLAYLNSSFVFLSPDEEKTVILTIITNNDQLADNRIRLFVKGTSNGELGVQDSINIKILINQTYSASIFADQTEYYVDPSEIINLDLLLTNLGNGEDTFNISVNQTASKNIEFLKIEPLDRTLLLDYSEIGLLDFNITIKKDAPANSVSEIIFDVRSFNIENLTLATLSIRININQIHNITLETEKSSKSGMPGQIVNFPINISNTGNGKESIRFELSGEKYRWGLLDIGSPYLILENGESKEINLRVLIPYGSIPNDLANIKITAVVGDETFSITTTTIVKQVHDLSLECDLPNKNANPGEIIIYDFIIKNNGNADDNFTLDVNLSESNIPKHTRYDPISVSETEWLIISEELDEIQNISDIRKMTVMVIPPLNAKANDKAEIVFEVFSFDNIVLDSLTITITVNQIFEISIEIDDNEKDIEPGQRTEYKIKVINNGNGEDTLRFGFSGGNSNWGHVNGSIFILEAGDYKNIPLIVNVPETAANYEKCIIEIQAVSKNGKISNILSSVTTVKIPENIEPKPNFKIIYKDKVVTAVKIGEQITFDASDSLDEDGEIVQYRWTIDNTEIRYGKIVDYTLPADTKAGRYKIILNVTDNDGASKEVEMTIEVSKEKEEDTLKKLILIVIIVIGIIIVLILVGLVNNLNKMGKIEESSTPLLMQEKAPKPVEMEKTPDVSKQHEISIEPKIEQQNEIDPDMWKPKIKEEVGKEETQKERMKKEEDLFN